MVLLKLKLLTSSLLRLVTLTEVLNCKRFRWKQ